ncbi:MAG: hypothetical protein AAGF95_10850 [Chloroflexota bacterium]
MSLLCAWLSDEHALRVVWRVQHCQRGTKGLDPWAGRGAQRPQPPSWNERREGGVEG